MDIKRIAYYEAKIEKSEELLGKAHETGEYVPPVQYVKRMVRTGDRPVVMAHWQSTSN